MNEFGTIMFVTDAFIADRPDTWQQDMISIVADQARSQGWTVTGEGEAHIAEPSSWFPDEVPEGLPSRADHGDRRWVRTAQSV